MLRRLKATVDVRTLTTCQRVQPFLVPKPCQATCRVHFRLLLRLVPLDFRQTRLADPDFDFAEKNPSWEADRLPEMRIRDQPVLVATLRRLVSARGQQASYGPL